MGAPSWGPVNVPKHVRLGASHACFDKVSRGMGNRGPNLSPEKQ